MTGMVEIDLLIIEIISTSIKIRNLDDVWTILVKKKKLPQQILNIQKYFNYPYFSDNSNFNYSNNLSKILISLEYLLWEWKSP